MGTYDIRFPWSAIALVVAFSLVLTVLGILVGGQPFPIKPGSAGWLGRLLGPPPALLCWWG